jgi:hypothetical protein
MATRISRGATGIRNGISSNGRLGQQPQATGRGAAEQGTMESGTQGIDEV